MKSLLCCCSILFAACLSLPACSSSENVHKAGGNTENTRPADSISDDRDRFQSLADFLQQVPGVTVLGSPGSQMVTIRGINSFSSGIEPLFVVNGQAVGSSYTQVNNMLNVKDIDYVRVLKGPDAAVYGVRGGNGVILIVTK